MFFYNPSSRTSLWERPEELTGRADVDKLILGPPDNNKGTLTHLCQKEFPGLTLPMPL